MEIKGTFCFGFGFAGFDQREEVIETRAFFDQSATRGS